MKPLAIPADRILSGIVEVPPSKSVTHRALLLALLAQREVIIERPLVADDTERLIEAIGRVGRIERHGHAVIVSSGGGARVGGADRVEIDCGASGTLLRLLLGVLATRPGRWLLDGDEQLRRRPVGPLIEALRSLGVAIDWLGAEGSVPLEVRGGALVGGRVAVDASASSQFVSALILAGLASEEGLEIEARNLVSAPYVELTVDCARRFGARIGGGSGRYLVEPGLRPPRRFSIEGDDSAAAYFAAGAALTGGTVRLRGLRPDGVQGDRAFLGLLETMGAAVERGTDEIVVRGTGRLEAVDAVMSDLPDQVPTLAALAPFARGTTRITGVEHLRAKESDRLAVMASELTRAGARVEERPDGLVIPGLWAAGAPSAGAVTVDPHDDHRVAMSLALTGLRRRGLSIGRPEVVGKSFPGFWAQLQSLLSAAPGEGPGERGA